MIARPTQRSRRLARWSDNTAGGSHCQGEPWNKCSDRRNRAKTSTIKRVVLILRDSGAKTPCKWRSCIGIHTAYLTFRTLSKGNIILRALVGSVTGIHAQSNRVPPSVAPTIEASLGGCREKGLSISIRYAPKLQMSPTSTLRATQIRCSTSMRTASLARSFW